ncbi:MAG: 1,4-alpha-glucan branching protein GlgB [Erysipelotrichaceae bacterium]|nr:1,4-alpha-glucan branching protein GlgB [Erysipelotrichaceae bacterium]
MDKYNAFFNGECIDAYKLFGAHKKRGGVEFTVYAPNAFKIELISSFNNWYGGYFFEKIDDRGIWRLFVADIEFIHSYKYRIYRDHNFYHDKIDPYAYYGELRPNNASVMYDLAYYKFSDNKFIKARNKDEDQPMNIYEVHINGFMRPEWKDFASYQDLKKYLIPYVLEGGYTHIELMPIFEHPFDGSWGYQASGFYSITSRYGSPYDLMDFINECHLNSIKVILDVVYTHFVKDEFSLVNYDFSPLYEYGDMNLKMSEWDTYYFNFQNPTVMSFVMSSAHFFAEKYHFDGFRFDAVSHFIYRKGNSELGENAEGINFLKRLNYSLNDKFPGISLIAEDSSAFANVTKRVEDGGLGFDFKWDLGWMNDTLKYYAMDHVYRKYHHNLMTFSMAYFYNEKFILPFSHDEVVHMKKTIIDKMFGYYDDKFALCKNLYTYMFMHPGKKLNFMGNDLALFKEFDESKELEWSMLKYPKHDSFKRFFRDLSMIYKSHKSLYENDYDSRYFKWIDVDNNEQSVFSFYREDAEGYLVCVLNMLPCSYQNYKIGVPILGSYLELINSEKDIYSGCNMCNYQPIDAKIEAQTYQNMNYSINIDLAPFAAIIFEVKKHEVV